MTQAERVKQYLEETGSITSLDAFRELGITRLSAVIFNLKKTVDIKTETVCFKNRYGENVYFAKYSIDKESGAQ